MGSVTKHLPVAAISNWEAHDSAHLDNATLAGSAYEMLRRGILDCHYMPGTRLRLEALRQHTQFGFSPLREALSRLTGEGLVEQEGQRGFRVAPVSIHDLQDIAAMRCEIEAMALRQSIERGGDDWETGVAAAAHHLGLVSGNGAQPGSPMANEWGRRHAAFHQALVSACGSPRLLGIRRELYEHSERYRRLLYAHGTGPRDVEAEHRAIAQTVMARDAKRACQLMNAHMRATVDNLMRILDQKNSLFPDVI